MKEFFARREYKKTLTGNIYTAASKVGACGLKFDIKHGFVVAEKQATKSAADKFNERARSAYCKWVADGCPDV